MTPWGTWLAKQRSTSTAINEAAASWLLQLEASPSSQLWTDFQKWLDAEPRHRAAFIRLRFAWQKSDQFKFFRPIDGRVDADIIAKL